MDNPNKTTNSQLHAWHHPLDIATNANKYHKEFVFLYSSAINHPFSRYSFLALDPLSQCIAQDFDQLQRLLNQSTATTPYWFGYFGYELESQELSVEPSYIRMPHSWFINYRAVLCFDHQTKQCISFGFTKSDLQLFDPVSSVAIQQPQILNIKSNMTRAQYLEHVQSILDHITSGTLYQANLTRKFFGEFTNTPNDFEIFKRLCHLNPAPYSAFLRLGDIVIISSSPEQFLCFSEDGSVSSTPIKGTIKRDVNPDVDRSLELQLYTSEKNRSENLMIVDLVRNDFSKGAITGSVKVENLFSIHSHQHLHHMSSTISAKVSPEVPTLDFIRYCFPPGSMTGAPKLKVIEICQQLEKMARGIYGGALGYIGPNNTAHLSVVIRTILIKHNAFEFQVGGGIVADSTAEDEWQETLLKAKSICQTLNIPMSQLMAL